MSPNIRTLQSLGCYLGMVLLIGEVAGAFAHVTFPTIVYGITGILIFAPMFGTDFVITVIKAVRSGADDRSTDGT